MTDDTKIRAAWERCNGHISELDSYIPATPHAYSRGYLDVESTADEIRSICDMLDAIAYFLDIDDDVFFDCRDRLRKLLPESD